MALSIGKSPRQMQVVRASVNDFLTDTSTDDQVITILGDTSNSSSRIVHVHNCWILCREAWAGGNVTATAGPELSDPDGFVTAFTNVAGQVANSDGALLRFQSQTITTAGSNTGTSGAGLSLIPSVNAITVTDNNGAASETAVNVVPNADGVWAHLESTTAGNADTYFNLASSSARVPVIDNDSPGGVQLYFDEDAASADSRFLCVSPTGGPLFVPCDNGEVIRVVHDASAATNGVAVYIDDDGGTTDARLQFVSPTDTNGQASTDDTIAFKTSGSTIMNDLKALQEDIANIETFLDNGVSFAPYSINIGSAGTNLVATIGTDTAWSALTAGEIIIGLEYTEPGSILT